jgi:hypothetical protein
MPPRTFPTAEAHTGDSATVFPWGRAGKTTQELAARKNLNLIRMINPKFKDLAQIVLGLSWLKSSERHR